LKVLLWNDSDSGSSFWDLVSILSEKLCDKRPDMLLAAFRQFPELSPFCNDDPTGKRENEVMMFRLLGFDLLGWRNDTIWKGYRVLQSAALSQMGKVQASKRSTL
jgi:hypothetical protein